MKNIWSKLITTPRFLIAYMKWLLTTCLIPVMAVSSEFPSQPAYGNSNCTHLISIDLRNDLSAADQLLLTGGVVRRNTKQTPLIRSFETYHLETTLEMISEVTGALRTINPDVVISGNLAGGFHNGRWVEMARDFDYLNTEMDVIGAIDNPDHFLTVATLTEAAGAVTMVMPNAASNARWAKKEDPAAYAFGTGLAYAMGAHMHVPWCLYENSPNRFYGSLKGHQPIFNMISSHKAFFDGYVPALWYLLEVPYGDDGIKDQTALESLLGKCFRRGIPALIRFRTKKGLRVDFGGERLTGNSVLTQVFNGQDTVLPKSSPVQLLNGTSKNITPPIIRVSAEASTAPAVFHLLCPPQAEKKNTSTAILNINPDWLPAKKITKIEVASVQYPDEPEPTVEWKAQANGSMLITVKNLHTWTMLRVLTQEAVQLPGAKRLAIRKQLAESEIPLMRMVRFDNRWERPQWVEDALASGSDPLDGYHITRISWSYDHSLKTLEYAEAHNMAFLGSEDFLQLHMSPAGSPIDNSTDILTCPADWNGWARYPSGYPMLIRPDWNPPRYGGSFASSEYRNAMIAQTKSWIKTGATGIQFDDVAGFLNRVWQYGGDFSDAFFLGFRNSLVEKEFPGITTNTSLDELRHSVIREMWEKTASSLVNVAGPDKKPVGWVAVPYRSGYPGLVWISTKPFSRPDSQLTVEYEIRFPDTHKPYADFLLLDGDRTTYLSRFSIRNSGDPQIPNNKWIPFKIQYDLDAQTYRFAAGSNSEWSSPIPFDMPLEKNITSLALAVMANPSRSGLDLRRINAELH